MVDQVKNACYGCILNEETVIKCNDAQDAVNNFLKTASKLTSIEENSELSSGRNNRINFHNRIFFSYFFSFHRWKQLRANHASGASSPRQREQQKQHEHHTEPGHQCGAGPAVEQEQRAAEQDRPSLPRLPRERGRSLGRFLLQHSEWEQTQLGSPTRSAAF